MRKKVYHSLKSILANITCGGRKETSFTAVSIIAKSFEFNHAHKFMEEQFSQLLEDKSSCVSQGKGKILRYGRHTMYCHMVECFQSKIIYFALIKSRLPH